MAIRLPIKTTANHVNSAIGFANLPNVFIALGKTSKWDGEDDEDFSAPLPDVNTRELTELIGMKRLDVKALVYPDEEGTIVYKGQNWRKVSEDEAIKYGAHWVYLEANVEYDDFPETAYRQIGIFSRVKRKEGVPEGKTVLLPDEIEDCGILDILDQRRVVTRNEDSKDTFSMIVEF